jgi:hypothetical protein
LGRGPAGLRTCADGCWAAALGWAAAACWAGKGRRAEIGKGKGRVEGLRFGNLEVWV